MSSEVANSVSGQRSDDPVFRFITPVSAGQFESQLPSTGNLRDVRTLTEGLDTLPDLRGTSKFRRNASTTDQVPQAPGSRTTLDFTSNIRPLSSDVLKELEEAHIRLNSHLDLQKIRKSGQEKMFKDYVEEGRENGIVNTVSYGANYLVNQPLYKLDKFFDWGLYTEPPSSLMDQNEKAVEECRAEISYRSSMIQSLSPLVAETGKKLDELKALNARLSEVTDARESLLLRKAMQEKVSEVVGLLDKAGKADSKELKEDWQNKMKGLSASLQNFVTQLDTTETVLESTQKGLIITAGILVSGGALAPGALAATGGALNASVAGLATSGGFVTSGLTGTAVAMTSSGIFLGTETISRGLYGENVLSQEYAQQKGTQFLHHAKDAVLYTFGNKIASGTVAVGGKVFSKMLSGSGFLLHGGKAASAVAGSTAEAQIITQGLYSRIKGWAYGKIGNFFGAGAEGGLTELAPAMVDAQMQFKNGKLDPNLWWNEVYHRVGLAAVGASVGRSVDGAVGKVSGGISGMPMHSLVKWGLLKPLGFVAEGITDLYSGTVSANIKDGFFYWGLDKLSLEERKQIVTSMMAGRFSTAASSYARNKVAVAHQHKVNAIAEAESQKIANLHSNLGVKDSAPSLLVATGNDAKLAVEGSKGTKGLKHSAHLGTDPEIGRRQSAQALTRQASLSADKALGGVIENQIINPLKGKLETVLPASKPATLFYHPTRQKMIDSIWKRASGVVASLSSHLGTNSRTGNEYGQNLTKLVTEYNNARKVTDTENLNTQQKKAIEREAKRNPFGADKEVEVIKVEEFQLKTAFKNGVEGTGRFLQSFVRDWPLIGRLVDGTFGRVIRWGYELSTRVKEGEEKKTTPESDEIKPKSKIKAAASFLYDVAIAPAAYLAAAVGAVSIFTPAASANPAIGIFLLYAFAQGRIVGDGANSTAYALNIVKKPVLALLSLNWKYGFSLVNNQTHGVDAGRVMTRLVEGEFLLKEVEAQKALGREILTEKQEQVLRSEVDDARNRSQQVLERPLAWWDWLGKSDAENLGKVNGDDGPKIDRLLTPEEEGFVRGALNDAFTKAAQTDMRQDVVLVKKACDSAHLYTVNLKDFATLMATTFGEKLLAGTRDTVHRSMLENLRTELNRQKRSVPHKNREGNIDLLEKKLALLETIDPSKPVQFKDVIEKLKTIDSDADAPKKGSKVASIKRPELDERARRIILEFEQVAADRRALQKEYMDVVAEYRISSSEKEFADFVKSQTRLIDAKVTKAGVDTASLTLPKVKLLKDTLEKVKGLSRSLKEDLESGVDVTAILNARRADSIPDFLLKYDLEQIAKGAELDLLIKRQWEEQRLAFGYVQFDPIFNAIIAKARLGDKNSVERARVREFVEIVYGRRKEYLIGKNKKFKDDEAYNKHIDEATDGFINSGGLKFEALYMAVAVKNMSNAEIWELIKKEWKTKPELLEEKFELAKMQRDWAPGRVREAFSKILEGYDPTGARLDSIMSKLLTGIRKVDSRFTVLLPYREVILENLGKIKKVTDTIGMLPKDLEMLEQCASLGDVNGVRGVFESYSGKINRVSEAEVLRLVEEIEVKVDYVENFISLLRFDSKYKGSAQSGQDIRRFLYDNDNILSKYSRWITGDRRVLVELGAIYDGLLVARYGSRPDLKIFADKVKNISKEQADFILAGVTDFLVPDSLVAINAKALLSQLAPVQLPPPDFQFRGDPVVH